MKFQLNPDGISAFETHGIPVDGGYRIQDLRAIAARYKIPGANRMTKNELIHVLNGLLEDED